MKPKPKITKASDGWRIQRPAYGFAGPESLGPFPSYAAALTRAHRGPASASGCAELSGTPAPDSPWHEWRHGHKIWQPVIR